MIRVRFRLPAEQKQQFQNWDIIKDAALNMLVAAGGTYESLVGEKASYWSAVPVVHRFIRSKEKGKPVKMDIREIIFSTIDPEIKNLLLKSKIENFVKDQTRTGEKINFANAKMVADPAPLIDGYSSFIEAYAISPILVSKEAKRTGIRWHTSLDDFNISTRVSRKLSRAVGRDVKLEIIPDQLYIDSKQQYTVLANLKGGIASSYAVGLVFPFTVHGSYEDLNLAWHAGLGEKNRWGFGFFDQTK